MLQQSDFSVLGRGIPLGITRTYNSRKADVSGMFGYGWTSNVETKIVDAGKGPITFMDGDGTRHIFGEEVGGGYKAHGGIYLNLVKNGDGTYTITQADGTKINFNTSGKLSSIIDTNNNKTELFYTNGKLTLIKDASLREVIINYGANGYVSSINIPSSRTISYEYDANGNLIKIIDPELKEISMGYDANHNLISIIDQRNIATTITYEAGSVKNISHPITINGLQTTSTTSYSYDFNNSVTTLIDGEGKRIDYLYNPNKNIVQITENPLDAQNKAVTTFFYDNNNNLTQIIEPNINKVNGTNAYVITYDANGNVTGVQLPEGQNSTTVYDQRNNPVVQTDFNGYQSINAYDNNNNQLQATDANIQTRASRYFSNGNIDYDTRMISSSDNLISNGNFENGITWPDKWTSSIENGKTALITWSSTARYGNKGLSISNPTGWVTVSSDKLPYEAGQKYVISGYIKTVNTTNSAYIKVDFYDANNVWKGHTYRYYLKGTHDWTRVFAVIDSAPAGTTQIAASVGMNAGAGTAYFDGIQLEKGTIVSAYSLVENAGFEKYDGQNMPFNWQTSGNLTVNDKVYLKSNQTDDNVYVGNASFKMTGETGKNKYIKQRINLSGDQNTKLTLSGWSKQEGANPSGGDYALQVIANYTDGSQGVFANDFSKTTEGWQHVAAEIKPAKAFNSIDVYYYYYNQAGTAYFDAMRLETGNSITGYQYDTNQNYITKVTNPIGNIVQYQYDAVGNKTGITDGKGKTTFFTYDKRNLLTKVKDAKLNETIYGYDNAGNRTTVTDARNKVTTYNYNEFNKVSKIINPLNQIIEFGYDKNGNTTKIIFPKGDTVSYSYNALNRLSEIYYNGVKKWDYGYDANGNINSVTETATGKNISYTFDKNNRVTKQQEGVSNSIDYGYDNNSNLTSLQITSGTASASYGYSYNSLNQIVNLTRNGGSIEKFIYDEQGNVISIKRSNGTYTSFEYDDANRLKALKNFNSTGELLDKYEYTYDENGNRTSVTTKNGIINYQYDELNQLIQEILLDGTTISYEYDAVGNRTKKTVTNGSSTITNYAYNDGNELVSVNGQVYTYNANGNLTSNGNKTFIYDVENRLIEVKNSSNQTIASFTYDHEGKRTSMTTASGTTYFHYSGDKVVYETDENNNIVAEYTYDAQGNPATIIKNGVTYYYHVNGHGDVMALTDESGNVVAEYNYDAYGNIVSQSGSMASANPLRYAGYRYDEATGLYYLMARYYDANVGRFITRDTFHGFEDEPRSLNQYAYTNNNPVMYIDKDGHAPTPIGIALSIIGGIAGWAFGDYVAKHLGCTGAKYWAVRSAVMLGGAVIGFFAGELVAGITTKYLIANANIAIQMPKWILQLIGYFKVLDNGVNFSLKATERMQQTGRFVPVQTLIDAIKNGVAKPDPRGSRAIMYYSQMIKNGVSYKLEVLYDRSTNSIWHFMYTK